MQSVFPKKVCAVKDMDFGLNFERLEPSHNCEDFKNHGFGIQALPLLLIHFSTKVRLKS